MIGKVLCSAGLHNDRTDAFGGHSPTCVRCDRPVSTGPTSTYRGTCMALCGLGMQVAALFRWHTGEHDWPLAMGAGVLLVLLGCAMIWRQ
jgi:ABC-type nickel/cobalt efflux system permease component RcnA